MRMYLIMYFCSHKLQHFPETQVFYIHFSYKLGLMDFKGIQGFVGKGKSWGLLMIGNHSNLQYRLT